MSGLHHGLRIDQITNNEAREDNKLIYINSTEMNISTGPLAVLVSPSFSGMSLV
jgi:hypothetical protein